MSSQVHIRTHKSILLDLMWLNVLRNSCSVPYFFCFVFKICSSLFKMRVSFTVGVLVWISQERAEDEDIRDMAEKLQGGRRCGRGKSMNPEDKPVESCR